MIDMDGGVLDGMSRFRCEVFPSQMPLYRRLVRDGQQPKALVISCSDSRVIPELITQCGPGELFVCRNAGNIVPPYGETIGGVSATIEYAVMALNVRDIVVCGHSECGAMGGLLHPEKVEPMPAVKAWLQHSHAAVSVFRETYPADLSPKEAGRAMALENVGAQLRNLRTHPSVAARLATGKVQLHGWFFDLETGLVHALDGQTGEFRPIEEQADTAAGLPIAVRGGGAGLVREIRAVQQADR
ncbi:carbonic anhydrase [Rhizosaccharibacter radicis]|uniref:Carbonic anhydrase n=1 Tax=Rhizosaccharibacter radicis TaxID=2782605 RepID=A0ABT1W000_9PROT|nr:carbonic anhydrase [Acetobacteraceae bacterium KSS12]